MSARKRHSRWSLGDIVAYRRKHAEPAKVIGRVIELNEGSANIQDASGTTYRVWPWSHQLRAATKREREQWLASTTTPIPMREGAPENARRANEVGTPAAGEPDEAPALEEAGGHDLPDAPGTRIERAPEQPHALDPRIEPESPEAAESAEDTLAEAVIARLKTRGVDLFAVGTDSLHVDAPANELTAADRDELRRMKAGILRVLGAAEPGAAEPVHAGNEPEEETAADLYPEDPETTVTAAHQQANNSEQNADRERSAQDAQAHDHAPQPIRFTYHDWLKDKLVPEITRGTEPQIRFARNLLHEYAEQTPQWLTELVCEEVNLCGATGIKNSVLWIEWLKRDPQKPKPFRRLYGTLHGILELCLSQYTHARTRYVPARLLAVVLYVSDVNAGQSTAWSPRLNKLLEEHPLQQDDATYLTSDFSHAWGRMAAEGLRRLDPESSAARWIAAATQPKEVPTLAQCTQLPILGPTRDMYTRLIVVVKGGAWWRVIAAAWSATEGRYHLVVEEDDGRTTRRKVAAEDILYSFFPASPVRA